MLSGFKKQLVVLRDSFRELREVFKGNVGVMALSWFLFSLTGSLINPFFAKYAKDLGAGDYEIALMRSLGSLALALSIIPGGLLTDYLGRVRIIIIGTGMVTAAQFLYATSPDWRWLTIVYVFDSASHFYQPALTAIVMDSLSRGREFRGFLALNIATSMPGLFMPIIGGFLYEFVGSMGIRYGFLVQGMVSLVVLVLRVKSLRETFKPRDRDFSGLIFDLAGYRGVLSKALKLYVYTSILWQVSMGVVNTYMALYVIDVLGLKPHYWGLISSISTLGSIVSSLFLIGSKIDVEKYTFASSLILSTCLFLYAVPSYIQSILASLTTLLITSVVSSIFSNILSSSLSANLTRILPIELRGRAVGIQRLLDNLGASMSSQIAALLYTSLGPARSLIASGLIGIGSSLYLYTIISRRSIVSS